VEVALRDAPDGVHIPVRAQPRGGRSALKGVSEAGALEVRVGAPPVDGAANEELVRFLAREVLRVPASRVSVVRGQSSRDKVVLVRELTLDAVRTQLSEALP
jgi:uncharacterized protein